MEAIAVFKGLKMFAEWLIVILIIAVIIQYLIAASPIGRDDTDEGRGWFARRSNMTVYTDHKTGCQYLATPSGGLTPRLDGEGKQICKYSKITAIN